MKAYEFLVKNTEESYFATDDLLVLFLPLMNQVLDCHENGEVAPLDGIENLLVEDRHLYYEEQYVQSVKSNKGKLEDLQREESLSFDVVAQTKTSHDLDSGRTEHEDVLIGDEEKGVDRLLFFSAFRSWEHVIGQHDELTDIFSLGILLASFALGMDLGDKEQLQHFVRNRKNLFNLNPDLHPVCADIIIKMTELNRHKRAQDLASLIFALEHYRERTIVEEVDFENYEGFKESSLSGRRQIIQNALKNRLFEISRRNRLIYYKENLSHLNLTQASVPMILDYKNIRPEQLFLWHPKLRGRLFGDHGLDLNLYLRFEEAIYLPSTLDKIRSEANKDIKEYGFAQLRLVLCFLNWHNLKENKDERISSPLLFIPVNLTKKKGVKDQYVLKATSSEAEVNPVLKHHLKELYDIDLPDSIDLSVAEVDDLYDLLKTQIQSSEKAVQLNKIEKPKIELILAKAKQRLNNYRKRARLSGKGVRFHGEINYSYTPKNYEPLGLQLFLQKVKTSKSPFAGIFDDNPNPKSSRMTSTETLPKTSKVVEKEKELYSLREEEGNPYSWSFDLSSMTLANFNYRKMSLVQDYNELIEKEEVSEAFEAIFTSDLKDHNKVGLEAVDFQKSYLIVPSDRSQMAAVQQARQGKSYIIQGPPGTGKSQTITNLIADYVARGKRVLFVCEKRAAIDVVYHRLHQAGLESLTSLIHDSQSDKKAFVLDLKETYSNFLENDPDANLPERQSDLAQRLQNSLEELKGFASLMSESDEGKSSAWKLLQVLISTSECSVSAEQEDLLPTLSDWESEIESLHKLKEALLEYDFKEVFAKFPYKNLQPKLVEEADGLSKIHELAGELLIFLNDLDELKGSFPEGEFPTSLADLESLLNFAHGIEALASRKLLSLLDGNSYLSRQWRQSLKKVKESQAEYKEAESHCQNWKQKFSEEETEVALGQAKSFEGSLFRFLSPRFWKLKKLMNANYDFSVHQLQPTWTSLLEKLLNYYACEKQFNKAQDDLEEEYQWQDIEHFESTVKDSRTLLNSSFKSWKKALVENDESIQNLILSLAQLYGRYDEFSKAYSQLFVNSEDLELEIIEEDLKQAKLCDRDALYLLGLFGKLSPNQQTLLQKLQYTQEQLKYLVANKEYQNICRENPQFKRFQSRKFADLRERFSKDYKSWLKLNGELIQYNAQMKFLENVKVSDLPAAELTSEQKAFKKIYKAGRRELEKEFTKKMRYKAIRSLASDETSEVLRDLKPIWLMSPLSVSDTLKMSTDEFDVVIFDEASQIQLEEAVPALYRSHQCIVVGDEKQLPPSRFFATSQGDDEDLSIEENGELYNYDLNADSFLSQSARTLPSKMLLWHYRSRYEDLIAFSNQAFYKGELLTVPDRQCKTEELGAIDISSVNEFTGSADELLKRSISYHHLENGIYEKRRNNDEAVYIAKLVRELLNKETGMSLGIVAFSEAQQGEIELELERLGKKDKAFRSLLEQEMEREEDGQHIGLFVKNLENVQGDERDIIILSICYTSDANGKMRMNFGPINKGGGEKRLNVIFSRAKQHMAVISSIKGERITNTYNDGANCLRNYLEYSEAVSMNHRSEAETILRRLHLSEGQKVSEMNHLAAKELAEVLRSHSYDVQLNVGQSNFRCELAVRKGEEFALAILFDNEAHYTQRDDLENFLLKPQVLDAFNWSFEFVLTKDWFAEKEAVIERILKRCSSL